MMVMAYKNNLRGVDWDPKFQNSMVGILGYPNGSLSEWVSNIKVLVIFLLI
jgi:hypothetical protein